MPGKLTSGVANSSDKTLTGSGNSDPGSLINPPPGNSISQESQSWDRVLFNSEEKNTV